MKFCTGLLNWHRTNIDRVIKSIHGDYFVVTNMEDESLYKKRKPMFVVHAPDEMNVAQSKNVMFDKFEEMKDHGYDGFFIMEDDVVVNDKNVMTEMALSGHKLNLDYVTWGLGKQGVNIAFNSIPNPIMELTNNGEIFTFHRYPLTTFMWINPTAEFVRFDERLDCLETEYFFHDLHQQGKYPFSGFYLDGDPSASKISRIRTSTGAPVERVRRSTVVHAERDVKTRGHKCEFQSDGGIVINYVQKQLGINQN